MFSDGFWSSSKAMFSRGFWAPSEEVDASESDSASSDSLCSSDPDDEDDDDEATGLSMLGVGAGEWAADEVAFDLESSRSSSTYACVLHDLGRQSVQGVVLASILAWPSRTKR